MMYKYFVRYSCYVPVMIQDENGSGMYTRKENSEIIKAKNVEEAIEKVKQNHSCTQILEINNVK